MLILKVLIKISVLTAVKLKGMIRIIRIFHPHPLTNLKQRSDHFVEMVASKLFYCFKINAEMLSTSPSASGSVGLAYVAILPAWSAGESFKM